MEMSHFDMKISKFSNHLLFDMHVGNDEKLNFYHGTTVKNAQMGLKIKVTRHCFSVFRNILEHHLAII